MNYTMPWISNQLWKPKFKEVSQREERKLFERFRAGDRQAREKIVSSNMKFVAQVANNYRNRGLPMEDVIAEGAVGLNKAVDRFDPTSGNKFITYAVWWIRQTILLALAETGRVINVPTTRITAFRKIQWTTDRLFKELEREPSPEEVAAAAGFRLDEVMEAITLCETTLSLGWEDEEGKERPMEAPGPLPDDGTMGSRAWAAMRKLMGDLSPLERQILFSYYGLRTGEPETLEEIAGTVGLTKERIRQIKEKTLKRIRQHARMIEAQEDAGVRAAKNIRRVRRVTSIGEASR